jgi:broad specificity phosphatase PhoE
VALDSDVEEQSMSLTLYFLRHGQTSCSRENLFCGSGLNPELTESGLEMAQSFAAAYRATEWSAIYASPLQRAVRTAQPICDAAGAEMRLRDELKEIGYGNWEGLTVEAVTREYAEDYQRWLADPAWFPPTVGERGVAIAYRGLRVIEEIKQQFNSGNILIVSHKATIRIILCSLLGIDIARFRYRLACPVASVSTVEFNEHGPLLRVLADRTHLSQELRNLPGT